MLVFIQNTRHFLVSKDLLFPAWLSFLEEQLCMCSGLCSRDVAFIETLEVETFWRAHQTFRERCADPQAWSPGERKWKMCSKRTKEPVWALATSSLPPVTGRCSRHAHGECPGSERPSPWQPLQREAQDSLQQPHAKDTVVAHSSKLECWLRGSHWKNRPLSLQSLLLKGFQWCSAHSRQVWKMSDTDRALVLNSKSSANGTWAL